MSPQPSSKAPAQAPGQKKRGGAGCLLLLALVVLALVWKCIPDSQVSWESTVPATPAPSPGQPPWPTDLPRPPLVPTYDVGYLRWAGTLQPGQFATWGGLALPASREIPVGGVPDVQPPCQVYGQVRVLAGPAVPFIVFDEANYRRWREGGKATARAAMNVSTEQEYALAQSTAPQYLVLDHRKGTTAVTVGLTGIQSCLRPLQSGGAPLQAQPRPAATWRLREEQFTLFGYLLHLLQGPAQAEVMTPPEIR
jgi:hypothetical protein